MEQNNHHKVWVSLLAALIIVSGILYVVFTNRSLSVDQYDNAVTNANNLFNGGDVDVAASELEQLLTQNLGEAQKLEVLVSLASVYAQKGSLEFKEEEYGAKAVSLIKQALEIDPNNSDAYRVMAYAYEIMEQYQDAITNYQNAIRLNNQNAMAYSGLGHAYDLMGEAEKSKEALQEAVRLDPELDHSLYNLARIYFTEKNAMLARQYAEQTIAVSKNTRFISEATSLLGILHMNAMEYDKAISLFEKAITLDDTLANNYVLLADAKMLAFGQNIFSIGISKIIEKQTALLTEVTMLIDKALDINPSLSSAYLVQARIFALQDNFDATRNALNTGLAAVDADITLSVGAKEKMRDNFTTQIRVYSNVTN
jgi:tetratricopeptide (TPR) repeat protein